MQFLSKSSTNHRELAEKCGKASSLRMSDQPRIPGVWCGRRAGHTAQFDATLRKRRQTKAWRGAKASLTAPIDAAPIATRRANTEGESVHSGRFIASGSFTAPR